MRLNDAQVVSVAYVVEGKEQAGWEELLGEKGNSQHAHSDLGIIPQSTASCERRDGIDVAGTARGQDDRVQNHRSIAHVLNKRLIILAELEAEHRRKSVQEEARRAKENDREQVLKETAFSTCRNDFVKQLAGWRDRIKQIADRPREVFGPDLYPATSQSRTPTVSKRRGISSMVATIRRNMRRATPAARYQMTLLGLRSSSSRNMRKLAWRRMAHWGIDGRA